MNTQRQKELEARGWKFCDAAEFLNLSPEEVAYIDVKINLSRTLKAQRKKAGLTQQALAKLIKTSQPRIAKMEDGDPTVTLDLLIKALLALGNTSGDLGKILKAKKKPIPA